MAKGRHRFSGPKYANGNHKSQQKAYVRTEKGKRIARNATRLNRKLGTYGNGDNLDSAHYEGSTTRGRSQHESINRASRTKKKNKKQTSHHLTMAKEKKNKSLLHIVKKNLHRAIPGGGLVGDAIKGGKKVHKQLTKKDEPTKTRKGRKLSPYEMKQAERKAAMQDRARKRHDAWKKERAKKREARKNKK